MLTQQGYIVMSIDNRGTPAPRGRSWRKCVYRQIGILASSDQAAALRAIINDRPYIDSNRIGIWGWSGGGTMSLNAIFRYPELYHLAIAIAFVADQRYYDTIYQERYMGLPDENAEDYRLGSPITFAHQLEGNLLIVHGTGDDNVHYQGTEALINSLVAAGKQFTMIRISFGLVAFDDFLHSGPIGVTSGNDLYILTTDLKIINRLDVCITAPATTDKAYSDTLIRTEFFTGHTFYRCPRNRNGGSGYSGPVNELPAS